MMTKRNDGLKAFIIISALILLSVSVLAGNIFESNINETYTPHGVEQKLFALILEDRATYNVAGGLMWDGKLATDAYSRAVDVMRSRNLGTGFASNDSVIDIRSKPFMRENIAIVSREEFERSYYHSPEYFMDQWRNGDKWFRLNELNRIHAYIGIGVAADDENYYIVARWR